MSIILQCDEILLSKVLTFADDMKFVVLGVETEANTRS